MVVAESDDARLVAHRSQGGEHVTTDRRRVGVVERRWRRASARQRSPRQVGIGPLDRRDASPSSDHFEARVDEHPLGRARTCDAIGRAHPVDVTRRRVPSEDLEHQPHVERWTRTPEADRTERPRPCDAAHLTQCALAPAPDPVDGDDRIERRIGPGQIEHRSEPDVHPGIASTGEFHEVRRRIDACDVGAVPTSLADRETGTARDVEHRRADVGVRQHRRQHLRGVVLVEARPVGRRPSPRITGDLPVVDTSGGVGGGERDLAGGAGC